MRLAVAVLLCACTNHVDTVHDIEPCAPSLMLCSNATCERACVDDPSGDGTACTASSPFQPGVTVRCFTTLVVDGLTGCCARGGNAGAAFGFWVCE